MYCNVILVEQIAVRGADTLQSGCYHVYLHYLHQYPTYINVGSTLRRAGEDVVEVGVMSGILPVSPAFDQVIFREAL